MAASSLSVYVHIVGSSGAPAGEEIGERVAGELLPEEGNEVQALILGQDVLHDELPRRLETLRHTRGRRCV